MLINVNVEVPDRDTCYKCQFLEPVAWSWFCEIFRCNLEWLDAFTAAKCSQCLNAKEVTE